MMVMMPVMPVMPVTYGATGSDGGVTVSEMLTTLALALADVICWHRRHWHSAARWTGRWRVRRGGVDRQEFIRN